MTYYEELGIAPNASAADIEHAYRRVAQLLERQQADDKLQAIASAQMRRIEQMVTVLSDPAQRRQYDERLLRRHSPEPGSAAAAATAPPRTRPAPVEPMWVEAPARRRKPVTSMREYAVWIVLFSLPILGAGWFWFSTQHSPSSAERAQASTVPNESALLASTGKAGESAVSDPTGERARVSHDLAGAWRATLPASAPTLPAATCQLEMQDEHGMVMGTVRFAHWGHAEAKEVTLKFHGPVRADSSQFLWQASDGSSGMLELEQFAPRLLQLQWTVNSHNTKTEMLQPGTVLLGRIGR